jgi:hypothetical protein
MVKIRVTRGVRAGLAGASGLFALTGAVTACTAPAQGEDVAETDDALTIQDPGTGVFKLGWVYGSPRGTSFVAQNSTDEYVRAREQMSFELPASYLWSQLYPNRAMPNDVDRLKKLSAEVRVHYVKGGAVYASTKVATKTWAGTSSWSLLATTGTFIVSRRAQGIRFEVAISDADEPASEAVVGQADFMEVSVIGGTLPTKTLLFDNLGGAMRSRVLEGGLPVRGAELDVAYTDWRAATVVDSSSIDRQIGTATSYGRFGPVEIPIFGALQYEITYGYSVDGAWHAEAPLTANAASRLLASRGRTAYETKLSLPGGAQKLEMYFHVKTFLEVDYSRATDIRWRKYRDGERILVREKWDNENGVVFDNYDFVTEQR